MPACRHFFSLQAWHWLRWALSTGHKPVPAWHLRPTVETVSGKENPVAHVACFPSMHLSPVNEPPPHAAFEEAAAAVAGVDPVMLAAAGVAAHLADQRRAQGLPRGRALGCGSDGAARLVRRARCLTPSAPASPESRGRGCLAQKICFSCLILIIKP